MALGGTARSRRSVTLGGSRGRCRCRGWVVRRRRNELVFGALGYVDGGVISGRLRHRRVPRTAGGQELAADAAPAGAKLYISPAAKSRTAPGAKRSVFKPRLKKEGAMTGNVIH